MFNFLCLSCTRPHIVATSSVCILNMSLQVVRYTSLIPLFSVYISCFNQDIVQYHIVLFILSSSVFFLIFLLNIVQHTCSVSLFSIHLYLSYCSQNILSCFYILLFILSCLPQFLTPLVYSILHRRTSSVYMSSGYLFM